MERLALAPAIVSSDCGRNLNHDLNGDGAESKYRELQKVVIRHFYSGKNLP